jgi:hypothetical protein
MSFGLQPNPPKRLEMLSSYAMEEFAALQTHFETFDLPSLARALQKHGVVQLPHFLPKPLHRALEQQVDGLLDAHGKRVDVRVRSTGNTPRRYVSVSRRAVFEHSSLIPQLYFDPVLIQFFGALAGTEVIPAPYEPEQIVVNLMNQEGDTHGWHWDDYTYSVVLVLAAPDRLNGARVECVDGTSWNKASAQIEHYLRAKAVCSLDLTAGAAYMLLGKRVMHRVSPMLRADTRKIICFTYATDAERHLVLNHGSMQDIYG